MKTKIIIIYLLLLISILGSSCVFKELDKPLGMTNGCPLYGQIIHRSGSPITNAQEAEKLFLEYKPNIDRGHFAPTLQQDNNEIDELIPFTGYTGGKKGVYIDGWVPVPYGWINIKDPSEGATISYGIFIGKDGNIYSFQECM